MSAEQIAILALFISFLSFAWGVFVFFWRGRPRPTIEIKRFHEKSFGNGPYMTGMTLELEVVNHEFQPIAIDSYGFMDNQGKKKYSDNPKDDENTIDGRHSRKYSIDVYAKRGATKKENWSNITHVYVEDVTRRIAVKEIPSGTSANMKKEIRSDKNP